jgi:dTDP-4-amino-4,6-dideoxygalactose transaminase
LSEQNIGTGLHYPIPLHLQEAYSHLGERGSLSETERLAAKILSLPMYPQLRREQQQQVVDALMRFHGKSTLSHAS